MCQHLAEKITCLHALSMICVLLTCFVIHSTHQLPGYSFNFLYYIPDFSEKEALYVCAGKCYGKRQYCETALELTYIYYCEY